MTADILIRDGIQIRRLKSGRCVREDEWKQFVALNEVRSSPHPDVLYLTSGQPLYLSYMLRNEPFEKLPLPYRPVQKLDHHPPRLSFGFAIPNEVLQFRRVALENHLGDPDEVSTTTSWFELWTLVIPFLNERCGLSLKEEIVCGDIHSKQAALALELKTNYRQRVPKEKMDDAIRVIKEVFHLPDDAKPKWYLEVDIDLKEPDDYLLPSKLPLYTWLWRRSEALHLSVVF